MTTHLLYRLLGAAVAVWALPTGTDAQYPAARQLSTTVEVRGSLQRPEGLSFELFGRPASIEFEIIAVNDSPDTLILPASFTTSLGLRVERAGRAVPTKTAWARIEVALPDDEAIEVNSAVPFNVLPQGVARFHGVLTPAESPAFAAGDYAMSLDFRRSFAGVRDATGSPWKGNSGEQAVIAIRVTEPRTPTEQRRANLAAANAAMLNGDAALALRHFSQMLRADPNDIDAQYGSGQAYLDLRRFREAAAAFESLIGRLPHDEHSTIYDDTAIAYLALGEDGRAETILANRYGVAAAKARLARLREAARKR